LVLDGTECTDNLIRVLDARGRYCGVLITSQSKQDVKEHLVEVDPLPFEDAEILLQSLAGHKVGDEHSRKRIYELVGDVTLAIELVGSYLRHEKEEPLEKYLSWLNERSIEVLSLGEHRRESVR